MASTSFNHWFQHTVTGWLRAVTRQRLTKHVITVPLRGNGSISTFSLLWILQRQWRNCCKRCFLCGPCRGYITRPKAEWESRVEAGSNTSTVALRLVGGDDKGSLESETVKYGRESEGSPTREWLPWRGPVAIANDSPVPSPESAPHISKPATVWQ
jgi:hypothetical protein